MSISYDNPTFVTDNSLPATNGTTILTVEQQNNGVKLKGHKTDRDTWGKEIEFLLSCIAMAVGLGNVWRFPFIALRNGGGAFVIPYIIILVLVGKPGYFLEMIMGQFSSRGTVKVYDSVPAMRGVGIGQTLCIMVVATYYSSIMAITLRYIFDSFSTVLPWSECNPNWTVPCYPSSGMGIGANHTWSNGTKSSAELYFLKEVLHAKDNIDDGIGWPSLNLVGCLIISWAIIFCILIKGIKSSGKASYITGIAPFIFLVIFFIRALTLPGALKGIAYFFTPKWEEILKPSVWFEACTQVFFTLNVFFVNVIMYASYNKFDHNIYRDSNIVTTLDTFTSLLVGCITFGIVGHLAHELNVEDVSQVFQGGPGLVFVTYPETISKFKFVPQLFSVMFFLMLYILALGSILAITSSVITVVRDQFKKVKNWQAALGFAIYGIIFGSFYTTPGGQSVLNLVDHYGANFVIFILACLEVYTFCYMYGVKRICDDVIFMLGFRPNIFWRVCWKFVTPAIMTGIAIYSLIFYKAPTDNGREYPETAHIIGWCITTLAIIWLPTFFIMRVMKQKENTLLDKIKAAFQPTTNWGPLNAQNNAKYKDYMTSK